MRDPVPEWLRGLWRRRSIEWPDGRFDDTTIVYWLQTASAFVDIRIPQPRQADDPLALARQGGFAGWTELGGERCRWHRRIDFQPPTGLADEGRLRRHGDTLIEHGVHEPYVEVWERLAVGSDAVCLERGSARELLVACGDVFLFARDRPRVLPRAPSLEALVRAAGNEEEIAGLLDCEISYGKRPVGRTAWEIELSTLPGRQGRSLDGAGGPR